MNNRGKEKKSKRKTNRVGWDRRQMDAEAIGKGGGKPEYEEGEANSKSSSKERRRGKGGRRGEGRRRRREGNRRNWGRRGAGGGKRVNFAKGTLVVAQLRIQSCRERASTEGRKSWPSDAPSRGGWPAWGRGLGFSQERFSRWGKAWNRLQIGFCLILTNNYDDFVLAPYLLSRRIIGVECTLLTYLLTYYGVSTSIYLCPSP